MSRAAGAVRGFFLADSAGRDSDGSSVKEITLIGSSGERISAGKRSGKRKGTVLNDRPG